MKNINYITYLIPTMKIWIILWTIGGLFSCSDFNPMDSYSRIPPTRETEIDNGDEGDGAGGLFEKGYGTKDKPYIIMNTAQIQNMIDGLVKGKTVYFQLGADIDMKSVSYWAPLNPKGDCFIYFDGNNHIIKNFTCIGENYASFFGILTGVCKNVGFYNAYVESTVNSGAGVLGGYLGLKSPSSIEQVGQVENCYVSGTVKGKYAGGITARMGRSFGNQNCYIKNCYSAVDVVATGDECGGIVGAMYQMSEVSFCYSTSSVVGANAAGGIAALMSEGAQVTNCVAWNQKVECSTRAARISGHLSLGDSGHEANPIASDCYAWDGIDCKGFIPSDNTTSVTSGSYNGVGENTANLQSKIANWGTPWHHIGNIDQGYPIFEWQLVRGDYESYGGHADNPDIDEPDEKFASGDGTLDNPYIIANVTHIQNMREALIEKQKIYFKLSADIDMQGVNWLPLNDGSGYHKWIDFDGCNHVIKNLTCLSGTYRSFFGVLCGECRNVGFVNANISSPNTGIGIIAGYVGLAAGAENYTGKITNCYTTGVLKGTGAAGGIGGVLGGSGYIKNCYSNATVIDQIANNTGKAGGIIGRVNGNADGSGIENCYASGDISTIGGGNTGGIVGKVDKGQLTIKNCIAWNSTLTSTDEIKVGRIVGGTANTTYENCYAYDGVILKAGETTFTVSDETAPSGSTFQGVAKPANELKSTVINWDSSLWKEGGNGYPVFEWSK